MKAIEVKINRAIKTNKLNPEILGERSWNQYFIRSTPLYWYNNLHDGYLIEVYNSKYGEHLCSINI